jgi:hypothetical protein
MVPEKILVSSASLFATGVPWKLEILKTKLHASQTDPMNQMPARRTF